MNTYIIPDFADVILTCRTLLSGILIGLSVVRLSLMSKEILASRIAFQCRQQDCRSQREEPKVAASPSPESQIIHEIRWCDMRGIFSLLTLRKDEEGREGRNEGTMCHVQSLSSCLSIFVLPFLFPSKRNYLFLLQDTVGCCKYGT